MTVVLALNAGSSTLKYGLFDVGDDVGRDGEQLLREDQWRIGAGVTPASVIDEIAADVHRHAPGGPQAVGHRVVHGGARLTKPTLVDESLMEELAALVPLAPLHAAGAIDAINAARESFPDVPHVACFDTAFHHTMPEVSYRLPIPAELANLGIRKYGFHGLSYEDAVRTIGAEPLGRAVIAHLGNGASLCAVQDGRSVDTTMGFTPAAGVVMGTRPGDLDPGVLVHLAARHGYGPDRLEHLIDHESGLLALSGDTGDMRLLLEREATDRRAALAIDVFCHSVRKHAAAMAAVMAGVDTIVFTGGVGENAPSIRARVIDNLGHMGAVLDPARNEANEAVISKDGSLCTVRVHVAGEARMIARHVVETAV